MEKWKRLRRNHCSCVSFAHSLKEERDLVQLTDALHGNTRLQELKLSFLNTFAESEASLQAMITTIIETKIKMLDLYLTHARGQPHAIFTHFLEAIHRSLTVHCLKFISGGCISPMLPIWLPNSQRLQNVWLYHLKNIPTEAPTSRETSLSLTTLVFCHLHLVEEDLTTLGQGLACNSAVTTLMIQGGSMNDDGVKSLLQHLGPKSLIGSLNLSDNKITGKGAMMLVQAASTSQVMHTLILDGNQNIGFDGLANLALELAQVNLIVLHLNDCIEIASTREACRVSNKLVTPLFLQGLNDNWHLRSFEVFNKAFFVFRGDANYFGTTIEFFMMRNMLTPLMKLSSLSPTATDHSQLLLPSAIWCHAFTRKRSSPSVIFYFLREQPMLWQGASSRPDRSNPCNNRKGTAILLNLLSVRCRRGARKVGM